jgi:RING finger protein 113A
MDLTVDQQIPICKDYHDTGYCTFGASCKFMHIRDDVLSSSQFDRKLALEAFRKSQQPPETPVEPPGSCPICAGAFANPVVTQCDHKFCGACAVARYRENHLCAVCGADTNGIFNAA